MKKFFKGLLIFFLVTVCLIAGVFLFCALDRKNALDAVPRDYTVYVHTDNAWSAFNPLLNLQAADVLFSQKEFVQYRQIFNDIKASPIRESRIVQLAAKRKIDFALYQSADGNGNPRQDFAAVVDFSYLSIATRLFPLYAGRLNVPDLTEKEIVLNTKGDTLKYYELNAGENVFYIKPLKNVVILTSSYSLLQTACFGSNSVLYTQEQKKLLKSKGDGNVRIVADARRLAMNITSSNAVLNDMCGLIDKNELSVIFFTITDSEITLKCKVPFYADPENPTSLDQLLSKNSINPKLPGKLGDSVQYYTLINAGSLEELKTALFPFIPKEKDAPAMWKKADGLCNSLLGMSLDELLFSWSGHEFAALGIENQNDPVFAISIKDEAKRQEIFGKITSSMFVNDDNSLIIGGVRLPQLKLPSFLNWVISIFDINIPSPYFLVKDGFIYFSESAESLSSLYTSYEAGKALKANENWRAVSYDQKNDSSVSLFYNLERSIPFFLRGKGLASQVFKLYSMGRLDGRIENNIVELQLHAVAASSGNLRQIPPFPFVLDGKTQAENFCLEDVKNTSVVFWVENKRIVKSLNLKSLESFSVEDSDDVMIESTVRKTDGGVLWSVNSRGAVSLYDETLQLVPGFPVMCGGIPSCRPAATDKYLVILLEGGKIAFINREGGIYTNDDLENCQWKSKPAVCGKFISMYAKGFEGKIYTFSDTSLINEKDPITVDGIGLGSPCVFKNGNKVYTAFITQSGTLSLWCDGKIQQEFPMKLSGMFLNNVCASSKYMYALSSDAVVYRIGLDGSVLSVKIPHATARDAYITANEKGVYVCADANMIYGFNDNLELLNGYPLTGWGYPVFADVNGDKVDDFISLTLDNKISVWNLR